MPRNILLIIVDDLRPQINTYGASEMVTPHLDALASRGVIFENAFVQQSICSPTRNSFLSGRYPDKTKTWNFVDDFRAEGPDWVALPQFFKEHGYWTGGAGKVYHPTHPPNFDQKLSWVGTWRDYGKCECGGTGWPPGGGASCEGIKPTPTTCGDDTIVDIVKGQLQMAANGTLGSSPTQPWLIAAGLHKPHLPFYARAEDFALYPNPSPPKPLNVSTDMPYVAWHSCLSNARGGLGSNWGNFTDIPNAMTFETPMAAASAARLRRGYSASVTYTDHNVGLIIGAMTPQQKETTIVLFMGDHGWSLGEQNVWCKMTNSENGVRVPLMIYAPETQQANGMKIAALAEAVDIYRTLADLSGLGDALVEAGVDGVSLAPLVNSVDPNAMPSKDLPRLIARSQFPRCYSQLTNASASSPEKLPILDRTDCQDILREDFDLMGYSIRTPTWRITEWRDWDGVALAGKWDGVANATELYYHGSAGSSSSSSGNGNGAVDPFASELANVVSNPAHAAILATLRAQLKNTFTTPQPKNNRRSYASQYVNIAVHG